MFLSSGSPTRSVAIRCFSFSTAGLGDRLLDEEPRAGAADVALVEVDAVDDPLDRLVERGVVEDDVRRLAAELERQLLAACRRAARWISLPTSVEPVKAILSTADSTSAAPVCAVAGDDVDDAGRELGLPEDVAEERAP